jgi:hypothetical protein
VESPRDARSHIHLDNISYEDRLERFEYDGGAPFHAART